MQAMLAGVTEPVAYSHVTTNARCDADRVWRRLRAVLPERHGIFILDGTQLFQQGSALVGVARQCRGSLGKIANCQVPVTSALWTAERA
jgi:SRSO17 transposase